MRTNPGDAQFAAAAAESPAQADESPEPNSEEHLEAMLDRALEATFPASDPIALTVFTRR